MWMEHPRAAVLQNAPAGEEKGLIIVGCRGVDKKKMLAKRNGNEKLRPVRGFLRPEELVFPSIKTHRATWLSAYPCLRLLATY